MIDPTQGALVGILDNWAWRREWALQREDRKTRAAADKESYKWIRGIKRAQRQLKLAGFSGRVIHTADREADDYKVFAYARRSRTHVIVRARHDRAIVEGAGTLGSDGGKAQMRWPVRLIEVRVGNDWWS